MLTRKQSHDMERAHRLNIFFSKDENKTIIATFEPFAEEVDSFTGNLKLADEAASGKEIKTSSTEEKTLLKHAVAKDLSVVCRKTASYAIKYGLTSLATAMNTTETAIFEKKDEDIQPFFVAENKLIAPLLTDANYKKYGVTQGTMDAIGKEADQFHGMIGQSGVNTSDYTVANTQVDKYLKLMAGNVEQFDLLIAEFADNYPNFVLSYHENARLGDDVIRHNGIQGTITDKKTGLPLAKAIVKLEGTNKVAVSDITGAYRLTEMKPGFYYVVVDAPGYEEIRILHRILKGDVETMDFEM